MKYILTDIDGVVLDWEQGFHEWMEKHKDDLQKVGEEGMYGVHNMYSLSREKARHYVNGFNESAAAGFLEPYRESEKYIPLINAEFGIQFVAVTSFGRESYSMTLRRNLLEDMFGDVWKEIYILDMGADKDNILLELAKNPDYTGSIWIEDKIENALAGAKAGFESLVMRHDHNDAWQPEGGDCSFCYVNDWKQIYFYIKDRMKKSVA